MASATARDVQAAKGCKDAPAPIYEGGSGHVPAGMVQRGTGLVARDTPWGQWLAEQSHAEWAGATLSLAHPEAAMMGECMVLCGLQRYSCLNGQVVRVLRAQAGSTRL